MNDIGHYEPISTSRLGPLPIPPISRTELVLPQDASPVVRGGQGRTAAETQDVGGASLTLAVATLFALLTIGAFVAELYVAAITGSLLTIVAVVATYLLMLKPVATSETLERLDIEA